MIVIRNSFRLKFGKAKDALAAIKEAVAVQKKAGSNFSYRILSDLTGPFYTLVLEVTAPSLAAMEAEMPKNMSLPDFQTAYQKFVQFVECGERQVFTIVE
jgi:hypothetical protein